MKNYVIAKKLATRNPQPEVCYFYAKNRYATKTAKSTRILNTSKWTYISRNGERNLITILHSPRLGHFLIFFNRKIVLADKKVFAQDSYSFFIDDELCVVNISIQDNKYSYSFHVDKQADTPLNKVRKKTDQKNLYYSLTAFGILFFMVALTMVSSFHYDDNKAWKSIKSSGVLTVGEVSIVEIRDGRYHIFYDYRVDKLSNRDELWSYKIPNPVLENGFPIHDGDAFLLTYAAEVNKNNKLHLDYPTPKTVNRYRAESQKKYLTHNPKASSPYCDCILDIVHKLKGWKGYAMVYNAENSSRKNDRFNKNTYQSFINSKPFLDAEIECWQFK